MNKPYSMGSKDEHDYSDKYAKSKVENFLRSLYGDELTKVTFNENEAKGNFSSGKFDGSFWLGDKEFKIECEARPKPGGADPFEPNAFWRDDPFAYETVNVPYRKHNNVADFYMLVSTRHDLIWWCPMANVLSSHVAPTIPVNSGLLEDFFKVELSAGQFYTKNNGKWVKWSKAI